MAYGFQGVLMLVGRILLCGIFAAGAAGNVMNFDKLVGYMTAKGVIDTDPMPQVLLGGAIALLVLGSVSVVLGFKARLGAVLLLLFLAGVTPVMHNFWQLEGQDQQQEMLNFLKNVSMAGGLLYVLAHGPGLFSLDVMMAKKEKH
jgi:putative oxidoreductase